MEQAVACQMAAVSGNPVEATRLREVAIVVSGEACGIINAETQVAVDGPNDNLTLIFALSLFISAVDWGDHAHFPAPQRFDGQRSTGWPLCG
jgi:hypothetical protein